MSTINRVYIYIKYQIKPNTLLPNLQANGGVLFDFISAAAAAILSKSTTLYSCSKVCCCHLTFVLIVPVYRECVVGVSQSR